MTNKTKVIFRKFSDGNVIALFPDDKDYPNPHNCSSYMHIGQHGEADPMLVIHTTKPATPEEYADLATELRSIGYDLTIRRRMKY